MLRSFGTAQFRFKCGRRNGLVTSVNWQEWPEVIRLTDTTFPIATEQQTSQPPLVSELTYHWHLDRKPSDFSANLPTKLWAVARNIRSKSILSSNNKFPPYWYFVLSSNIYFTFSSKISEATLLKKFFARILERYPTGWWSMSWHDMQMKSNLILSAVRSTVPVVFRKAAYLVPCYVLYTLMVCQSI